MMNRLAAAAWGGASGVWLIEVMKTPTVLNSITLLLSVACCVFYVVMGD